MEGCVTRPHVGLGREDGVYVNTISQAIQHLGAKFFRVDLHLHTPASLDYEDKRTSSADYVKAALDAGLDIIAVTDHNSAEWVDVVRSAARNTALVVFPGVEITTPICHFLVIFDAECSKAKIDEFLSIVGISIEVRGRVEAMASFPEKVLETAKTSGALVIAAHANSTNGLLQHRKGQYRMQITARSDLAALELSSELDVANFTAGKIPGYPPKACTCGSDAHHLGDIGRRSAYLKMDSANLRGLEQALLDYTVRVRFPWNLPVAKHPRILDLEVNQGFFEGSKFVFHPNLNCFVGGKGVGKSTVVELLRFGFGDVSSIEEIAEDNRGKLATLLGPGGKIRITYLDSDEEIKIIEREVQEWSPPRSVRSSQGSPTELLANPVLFSQGELTRIASSLPAQMDLIDRYVDISAENGIEASLIGQLDASAGQVQEATYRIEQLDLDLGDKEKGLKITEARYASMEKTLKQEILRLFPKWEAEDRYLKETEKGFELLDAEIESAIDQIAVEQMFPLELDESMPNFHELQAASKELAKVPAILEATSRTLREEIAGLLSAVKRVRRSWLPKFEAHTRIYEKAVKQLGQDDLKKANVSLRALGKRRDDLRAKEKERKGTAAEITTLREGRTKLLKQLADIRSSRFKKRSDKATELQLSLRNKIHVSVREGYDRKKYLAGLRAILKGGNIREADLKLITSVADPETLVAIADANDAQALVEGTEVKPETAARVIQVLRSRPVKDLLALEAVELFDEPLIEYQVSDGRPKPLNELSTGQKGTVIISLALVEGDSPLVIDQPEEPLDTLAIHEQVVGTLRSQKDGRQFIFTTHNANVAVGADAELSYVLDATADKGCVAASGGIDEEETNKLLLIHLEGGAEALERRAQKYIRTRV